MYVEVIEKDECVKKCKKKQNKQTTVIRIHWRSNSGRKQYLTDDSELPRM